MLFLQIDNYRKKIEKAQRDLNFLVRKLCGQFFEGSFLYAALTLWKKLSIDIRMDEFDQLKSRVKTELYLKYF